MIFSEKKRKKEILFWHFEFELYVCFSKLNFFNISLSKMEYFKPKYFLLLISFYYVLKNIEF